MKFVYHIHSEEMLKTFYNVIIIQRKQLAPLNVMALLIINRQPVTVRYMLKRRSTYC